MSRLQLIFAISQLKGGGAEHVMISLANYMFAKGHEVQMIVTNQKSKNSDCIGLNPNINVIFLEDNITNISSKRISVRTINFFCKFFETLGLKVPHILSQKAFKNIYGKHVKEARKVLETKEGSTVIVFLQPANQIMLKACDDIDIRLVISERGDPIRYFKTRYANFFLKKYYPTVHGAVFQTPEAMEQYTTISTSNKCIIPNPISTRLPEPYLGDREKVIVNFCRLARQKNLPLLIDAFEIFCESHDGYILEIIGDGELREELCEYIRTKKHADRIRLINHMDEVHLRIRKYAMFVSSSDYEGMSNSMLEAMAIGLPVICTDCPIGGARFIIKDHDNGILVPVNNAVCLANAMGELADDEELSHKISINSIKVREEQSIDKIGLMWEEIIRNAQ